LSEELGPLLYSEDEGEVFLGRSAASQSKSFSGETAIAIDVEVRKIIDECYGRATKILEDHMPQLELMKDALMEYETIDADMIDDIMKGERPRPPADWSDSDSSSSDSGGSSATEASSEDEDKSGAIDGVASEH
jgi:cell division protease FtsH